MRSTFLRASLLVPALTATSACTTDDPDQSSTSAISDADESVVLLDQGWSPELRSRFYTTTQGSRMLPYDWFLALERPTSRQKLRAASNMRRMGFLVDDRTADNPDRLPVGFAKDVHPTRGASVGLTCAACHTGQLEYNGTQVRIDGGQSMVDLEAFQDELLASLNATLADADKFSRFAADVLADPSEAASAGLRAELTAVRDWWAARITRSRGLSPHGPSRTDAFTIIGNEVACKLLDIPANCNVAFAPTQFPFLWNTPDFDWVQYNSSVHNPLGRNVGEVTGVFAELGFAANGTLDSTANIDNLYVLEETLKSLRAPSWPEHILGPIDHELAAAGEEIFVAQCASCHTEDPQPRTAPNRFGMTFAKVNFETPLAVLGTDRSAALAFATRRALPGPFAPTFAAAGLIGPDGKVPLPALLNVATGSIIQKFFAANAFPTLKQLQYIGFRESLSPSTAQLTTYKARPLNGIAFTPPYLHNGSVASIYELLLPAAQRMPAFEVGSKAYDPVVLGYSTARTAHSVAFDTTEVGNANSGHEFGTSLDHAARMALIEYLKTL